MNRYGMFLFRNEKGTELFSVERNENRNEKHFVLTPCVVCPNVMQNIAVMSTPAENARAYFNITTITVGVASYEVSAYRAAPDNTCKGVIKGIDSNIGEEQLYSLIVHPRNPTRLQLKRIKKIHHGDSPF